MILIAERDQTVRDLQRFFLRNAGYDVWFADNGEAILRQARDAQPALIITEILIPKIDGLTLCRRLRADPATQAIPLFVFSILAAEGRARDAGASAFLRKPLVETTFLATVQAVIAAQPFVQKEHQWASS